MTVTVERLVATLEARIDKYQRDLAKASQTTGLEFKAIEDRGAAMASKLKEVTSRGAQGFGQTSKAVSDLRGQTGNLAAQFNDIAVQLSGGQSPFLIAMQQGSQISQVLGGAGARGAVSALGGAFLSMINPVSLATIAIIALGGTAVQYFTSLLDDGAKSEETLKRQAGLIQQLADKWGDAVPAIRAYAEEQKRVQEQASLAEGVSIINENTLANVRPQIDDVRIAFAALLQDIQTINQQSENIRPLQEAFEAFTKAAEDGSLQVEQVQAVQAALASAIEAQGLPTLDGFAAGFERLAAAALKASSAVQTTNAAAAGASLSSQNLATLGAIPPVRSSGGAFINEAQYQDVVAGQTQSQTQIEAARAARSSGNSGGGGGESDLERERKAVADLIVTLEFERSLIGKTNKEREIANALRRAGTAATPEQRREIELLVTAIQDEEAALKASKEAMAAMQDLGKDLLGGFISDLRQGKTAADALRNALDRIADRLLDGALDSLFGGNLLSGGTSAGGGFLKSILGLFTRRETGGPVSAGQPYIVGEKRAELFVPSTNGRILSSVPKVPSPGDLASASGGTVAVTYAPQIDARGASVEAVARLEQAMTRQRQDLEANVISIVRKARNSRVKGL